MIFPTQDEVDQITGDTVSDLTVPVQPFVVGVSPLIPGSTPAAMPTWGKWHTEDRLQVLTIFKGSSIAGMSYAKLKLAIGAPNSSGTARVETEDVCKLGDRIAIGIADGQNVRWKFAGYVTSAQIGLAAESESILIRVSGPEWIWGGDPRGGAYNPVVGQIRRLDDYDDKYAQSIPTGTVQITPRKGMKAFTAERAVFNPDGKYNRSFYQADFSQDSEPQLLAYPWEMTNRAINGLEVSDPWRKLYAAQTVFCWWNDKTVTGIEVDDWDETPLGDSDVMPETDVEGLGLWEALQRIIGPEFYFRVDPTPSSDNGLEFKGFKLTFYKRGEGPETELWLNPPGTSMVDAKASIVRLEAVRDISKTVNKATVLGTVVRHIKLIYWGSQTPTLKGTKRQLALQHGWHSGEGDTATYKVTDQAGKEVIDRVGLESLSATTAAQWMDRFCTSGKQFVSYAHVFRLFVWNEAGEWQSEGGNKPKYGSTPLEWYRPLLADIADNAPDGLFGYYRRRRKLLDTAYLEGSADEWRRVPPIVFIAAAKASDPTQTGPWVRLPLGSYQIDPERAAVWIKVDSLHTWQPLKDLLNPDDSTLYDTRTFATLLHTGALRLMVEASVEADWAMTKKADRQAESGSPIVREVVARHEKDFIVSSVYADGQTSPTGATPDPLDTSADATTLAEQIRDAGQDQQTHASVLVAGDWPEQQIGSVLRKTKGRIIDLAAGTSEDARGAQIVAVSMDATAMKWELLTESAALQLRDRDRFHLSKQKHKFMQASNKTRREDLPIPIPTAQLGEMA